MKYEIERQDEVVDWVMDWTKHKSEWKESFELEKDLFRNFLVFDGGKSSADRKSTQFCYKLFHNSKKLGLMTDIRNLFEDFKK